jgi:pimeloyl-ACP methyl ester carboxylesterase
VRDGTAVAPRERRLALPTLELAARCWGSPQGAPVLALHGWLDNAASFDRLAPALVAALPPGAVQLVALDLPGHGLSQWRPAGAAYAMGDYVLDVLAAADALGWSRFSILGHSLGAAIATLLGGACPERLDAAVLIDGLGPLSVPAAEAPALMARAVADARRPPGPPRQLTCLDEAVQARCRGRFPLGPDAARRLCARGTMSVPGGGLHWRADPRLRHASVTRFTEETVLAFVSRMEVPTLLVQARDGALQAAAEDYARRAAAHPRLERVVLEGNHHLHLDGDIAPVVAHCAGFLRRQPGVAGAVASRRRTDGPASTAEGSRA